jgi:hypothetical protein
MEMREGIQIELKHPDSFLKIKETLSRIGVANGRDKKLYQSCHILHKRGNYYIMHFKEMFILDGKPSNMTSDDYARRNLIASLLEGWGLMQIKFKEQIKEISAINSIKILPYGEKRNWTLVQKYSVGSKVKL